MNGKSYLTMRKLLTTTLAATIVLSCLGAAPALADTGDQSVVDIALDQASVTVFVDEGADVAVDTGAPIVIDAIVDGVQISIPSNPEAPITVAADGGAALEITLPESARATTAEPVGGSSVGFDNGDGSATVPVIHDDGTLQVLSVLTDPAAPTEFTYSFESGVGTTVSATPDGGFAIFNAASEEVATAPAPWATDASGNSIPTHYEIDGQLVTQVVDTSALASSDYPVVADPAISVTKYEYKYINVVKSTNWTNKSRQLGICKVQAGAGGGTCSISNSYSVSTTVDASFGISYKDVAANIGISATKSVTGTITWTSGVAPVGSSFKAWAVGTHVTYKIQKWKVTKSGGRTIRSLQSTSGTLAAFSPVKGFAVGQ